MNRLHDLEKNVVLERNAASPARVYSNDRIQHIRIMHARNAVKKILLAFKSEYVSTAHTMRTVVELGCNTADISGMISMGHKVKVWEVSPKCIEYIARTYPWIEIHAEDIETATPIDSDLIILCEILEHLSDPNEVVRKWLPKAKYALISSPLRGDLEVDLSGGEHCWSFDPEDFDNFVKIGGHQIMDQTSFAMGQYVIKMMATKRKE